MKIWYGYGSEHSINLVMVGHFKSAEDAKKTKILLDQGTEGLEGKIDVGSTQDRYSNEVMDLLSKLKCHILSPPELENFLYGIYPELKGDKIIITTDESDVSAFLKVMVDNGAKVETYSAHEYPEAEYGRGK